MLVNNGLIISLMQIVKYIINGNLSCLGFYCSQNFKLFGFPIFGILAYLLMIIPETRRAQYIWYLLRQWHGFLLYWNLQFQNNVNINKTNVINDLCRLWLSLLGSLVLMLLKLYIIWYSNLLILSVPDDGYPRNASCALN